MRHIILIATALLAGVAAAQIASAEDGRQPSAAPPEHPKTGKERLGDKGSDEQRLDDCKVPTARRTKTRPTKCPWDVEAAHVVRPGTAAPATTRRTA